MKVRRRRRLDLTGEQAKTATARRALLQTHLHLFPGLQQSWSMLLKTLLLSGCLLLAVLRDQVERGLGGRDPRSRMLHDLGKLAAKLLRPLLRDLLSGMGQSPAELGLAPVVVVLRRLANRRSSL